MSQYNYDKRLKSLMQKIFNYTPTNLEFLQPNEESLKLLYENCIDKIKHSSINDERSVVDGPLIYDERKPFTSDGPLIVDERWKSLSLENRVKRASKRVREIINYIRPTENSTFLEIGSGDGLVGYSLSKNFKCNVKMVDVDDFIDEDIRNDIDFYKIPPQHEFPFENGSIDYIIILQTLHHMTDLDLKLKEIMRVLKPGGKVIIREHNCKNEIDQLLIDAEHKLYNIKENNFDQEEFIIYGDKKFWNNKFYYNKMKCIFSTRPFGPTNYYYAVFQKLN